MSKRTVWVVERKRKKVKTASWVVYSAHFFLNECKESIRCNSLDYIYRIVKYVPEVEK